MRVFVTGATGFIGSAIVQELMSVGHQVLGLARTDAAADALAGLGIKAHRGDLSDIDSLAAGARACDGVIHTAFIHNYGDRTAAGETDRRAIEAFGAALAGSGRPLIATSGTAHLPAGRIGTEEDAPDPAAPSTHRVASEETTLALASRGVRAMVLRLPPSVHGDGDRAFVPRLIAVAREKGASVYVGDGLNRWPAVHRLDAARLYRLVLEGGIAGARYHGIADQAVPLRDIADIIGLRLDLPVVSKSLDAAVDDLGFLGRVLAIDCPASGAWTREHLGWHPREVGLLVDLQQGRYFEI